MMVDFGNAAASPSRARSRPPGRIRRQANVLRYHLRALLFNPGGAIIAAVVAASYGLLIFDACFPYRIEWDHLPVTATRGEQYSSGEHPIKVVTGIDRPFIAYAAFIATFGLAIAAYARTAYFHPSYMQDYCDWLALTPWNAAQPLPFGSPIVHWRDLPWLAILIGPFVNYPAMVAWMSTAAFTIATSVLAITAWRAACDGWAWSAAMLLGLVVRFLDTPWVVIAAAVAYVVAGLGWRKSLPCFPWPKREDWWTDAFSQQSRQRSAANSAPAPAISRAELPWPFRELVGGTADLHCSIKTATLIALLVGWWHYVGLALFARTPGYREQVGSGLAVGTLAAFGLAMALLRYLIYRNGLAPPISLFGRFALRRYWIHSYDQTKLAPLLMIFVVGCGCWLTRSAGNSAEICAAASTGLIAFIGLAAGPAYAQWRLTGGFRVVPEWMQKQIGIERI